MFSHTSRPKLLRTLAGVACIAVSGAAGALVARQPEPLPPAAPVVAKPQAAPAAPAVAVNDVNLARSVLSAIDADPVLKDVNLIVSVVDRSAVVGGPVVSEDVKKRVEMVVRGVRGVESVKNVCFVQTDPDPLLRAVAERMKPGARPGSPAVLPGVALAPTAPEGHLPPVGALPATDLLAGAKPNNTVVAQAPTLPPVSVLGAPVAPAGNGTTAKVSPLPLVANPVPATPMFPTGSGSLTGSGPEPLKAIDVRTAVAALKKADPRFARLTVELKPDGGLFVSGWSARSDDARAFAAELRRLPGAGRVVIDPVLVR